MPSGNWATSGPGTTSAVSVNDEILRFSGTYISGVTYSDAFAALDLPADAYGKTKAIIKGIATGRAGNKHSIYVGTSMYFTPQLNGQTPVSFSAVVNVPAIKQGDQIKLQMNCYPDIPANITLTSFLLI